jgi:hypothetical protein
MRDDDGDNGSDSKKPWTEKKGSNHIVTEKKGSNHIVTDKGVALKAFPIVCWKLQHRVNSVSNAVPRSIDMCS